MSSDVDDRTLQEIYISPYLRAIEADVAGIMCSYNKVNGVFEQLWSTALLIIIFRDIRLRSSDAHGAQRHSAQAEQICRLLCQ